MTGVFGVGDDEGGAGPVVAGGQGTAALLEAAQLGQGGVGIRQQRFAEIGQ